MAEEENILEKFKSKEFGFNGRKSIVRCIVGDNVFIVKDNNDGTYNFIKISKTDYNNFYENEKEKKNNDVSNAIINYIEFDQTFFNKNKDKFIKSLNEQQLNFDDVKQMQSEEFKKLKVSGTQLQNIKTIEHKLIPEPIPEDAAKQRLGSFGDEDEEEEGRMVDEEKPIQEEKKDDEEKPLQEEEEEEEEDNDQILNSRDFEKNIEEIQIEKQKKQRSGKMGKEDMDVFDQLTRELNFTQPDKKAGKSYLKVGDDVIFIRKPQKKQKGVSQLGENNYLAVKLNKEDVQRIYTEKDLDKIEAEYFNFSTDYFYKNKEKIIDSIKKGNFVLDDELIKNKEESGLPEKFKFEDLETYDVIPEEKKFDYVNVLGLRNGNISKERGDDGQQIINFSKDGKNVIVNLPNKYLSNGYPDSLLKLIVGVSENNKGEVDFKEIGEIQDLNGDITNLYSKMQELKTKINSSNNAEEKERLLIEYNEKRLKFEDLIKKYSKEAYRLSTLNKKKKATYSNPNYIKNKLNRL